MQHGMCVRVRGQLTGVCCLVCHVGTRDQTQVVRHGDKPLYLLSHLCTPSVFKISVLCIGPRTSCMLGKFYHWAVAKSSPCGFLCLFLFETGYFTSLGKQVNLANGRPSRICLSSPPSAGITNVPHHNQLFIWGLGIKLRPLSEPSPWYIHASLDITHGSTLTISPAHTHFWHCTQAHTHRLLSMNTRL